MAWQTPANRSDGDLITRTLFKAQVTDNIRYLGMLFQLSNLTNTGADISANDVVVMDNTADNSITISSAVDNQRVLGIATAAINSGETGTIQIGGAITVNVQGNVTRGNFIETSTTLGRASDTGGNNSVTPGTFGIALTSYTGGSAGTVTAVLLGSQSSGKVPSNIVFFVNDATVPGTFSEYTSARGRVIVGRPSGGADEGTVGTALTDQQDKTHTHTYSEVVSHTHTGAYDTSTGSSQTFYSTSASGAGVVTSVSSNNPAGGVAEGTTSATSHMTPYIQLLAIQGL